MIYYEWPKGTRVRLSEAGRVHLKPPQGSSENGMGTVVMGTQRPGFVNVRWDGDGTATHHHYRKDFIETT